jgi:hypothetical protein
MQFLAFPCLVQFCSWLYVGCIIDYPARTADGAGTASRAHSWKSGSAGVQQQVSWPHINAILSVYSFAEHAIDIGFVIRLLR